MIVAVLQARMSSTRLPGKVLKQILGEPMIARQVERIARSRLIDRLVVATSGHPSDDKIAAWAAAADIDCYRGALDDVLDRFYQVAKRSEADHIVRLTADCPFTDPALIDRLIGFHLHGRYDYSSNVLHPQFPDGLDVEVMTRGALEAAWSEATKPSEREHVTPFLIANGERFSLGSLVADEDNAAVRLTVDEQEDLEVARQIYLALYPGNPAFTTADVLALLDARPELAEMNAHFRRNEGYKRSLEDAQPDSPAS